MPSSVNRWTIFFFLFTRVNFVRSARNVLPLKLLSPQCHLANQMSAFSFCQKIYFSGRKEVDIASKHSEIRLPAIVRLLL